MIFQSLSHRKFLSYHRQKDNRAKFHSAPFPSKYSTSCKTPPVHFCLWDTPQGRQPTVSHWLITSILSKAQHMGTFQTMALQWILETMDAWAVWGLWLKVDSDADEDTRSFHMPSTIWSGWNQQPHKPLKILLNLKKAGCYQRRVSQRTWMLCSGMGPLKLKQSESNSREVDEESSTKGRQCTLPCQGKNRAKLHSASFQRA